MVQRASGDPDLGFRVGDHVCAFYSSSSNSLDDIVVDYLSAGLQAGHKCFGMVDTPSSVRDRIPGDLVSRDGMLRILTEDEAYMPDGRFSKDTFISNMRAMVQEAFAEGYDRFRAVGDESFIIRNAVDIREWFAAEAALNEIVPDYPHFFSACTTSTFSTATRSCTCSGPIPGSTSTGSSSPTRTTSRQISFPGN